MAVQPLSETDHLAQAVDAAGLGLWRYDLVTGELEWSERLRAFYGLGPDDPITYEIYQTGVHPDDRPETRAIFERTLADPNGRDFRVEHRTVAPDGTIRWVIGHGRIIRAPDGTPQMVVGTSWDISARKAAELALAESERRLDLAVRARGIGIFDWDAGTGRLLWNREHERLLGLPPGSFGGTLEHWLALVHPDDRDQVLARMQKHTRERAASSEFTLRMLHVDGEVRHMEGSCLFFYDAEGKPTRMVGVSLDVTEQRRALERERLLSREVDHRAKNALAVVQSLIRLTPFVTREAFTETLTGRINSMARVHTILSRNAWRGATVGELVAAELAAYDHAGRVVAEGPEVSLRLEAAQPLSLLLHELATNAGKYGALSTHEGRLAVRWRGNGERALTLEWIETGGPPSAPTTRAGFGTKLIDGAAAQLAGAVTRDWLPQGLHCTVEIGFSQIRQEPVAAPSAPPPRRPVHSLAGSRVLVVEDETLLALELSERLREAGAAVIGPANTVEQALTMARMETFDCAVLDINLGGRSAEPVIEAVKHLQTPFVVVTGYEDAGVQAPVILKKPIDHSQLLALLAGQLEAAS